MLNSPPDWATEGRDWPNRASSRFIETPGLRWHVQDTGRAEGPGDEPVILLLHGTGAATHSWRDVLPLLAPAARVVAPDLPGHGFTTAAGYGASTLPAMAGQVGALLRALDVRPTLVVGHSAGAAVAVRLSLDGTVGAAPIVSLNGALLPMSGPASFLVPAAARLFALNPLAPWLVSLQTGGFGGFGGGGAERLLAGTGSRIDAAGSRFYGRLLANPGHVAGVLRMMADWSVEGLDLRAVRVPVLVVSGLADGMVTPAEGRRAAGLMPGARLVELPALGHLAHEEAPDAVAGLIRGMLPGG